MKDLNYKTIYKKVLPEKIKIIQLTNETYPFLAIPIDINIFHAYSIYKCLRNKSIKKLLYYSYPNNIES